MYWFNRVDEAFLPVRRHKKGVNLVYGIEVEIEFTSNDDFPDGCDSQYVYSCFEEMKEDGKLSNWKCEQDGSLRNGLEFITKTPHTLTNIVKEANELYDWLDNFPYDLSRRCSTHIHVDVRDFNTAQMFALILMWGVYEYDWINILAQERHNNKFCLTDYITPNNASFKFSCLGPVHRVLNARTRGANYRYTALNVCDPMLHQGSVEFRSMQGNTDITSLQQWLNRITVIVNTARRFNTPISMYRLYNALRCKPALFKRIVFGCYPIYPINEMMLDSAELDILGDLSMNEKQEICEDDIQLITVAL